MQLHGVVNASPDSVAEFSVVGNVAQARSRAEWLIDQGCAGIDLGGAGSTQYAERVDVTTEWSRIDGMIEVIRDLDVDVSVDTWQPEVMRRALDSGATIMNAADGLQNPAMVELAAQRDVPIVLPFLSGLDPKAMHCITGDPISEIRTWFSAALKRLSAAGIDRSRLILDPGTGFGPDNWEWQDRYRYQRSVYSNLDALRTFGLPIYLALPWKQTPTHDELLEICVRAGFEYGRCHHPDRVNAAIARIRAADRVR